jgi:hypothetical protein
VTAAQGWLRVTLEPGARVRRERQNTMRGVAQVGGLHFFDGVAYAPASSTVVQRLRAGVWMGAELSPADPAGLSAYRQRLHDLYEPVAPKRTECHPGGGGCAFGPGHSCRTHSPQNFPRPKPPRGGVAL